MVQWIDLCDGLAVDARYVQVVRVLPPTRPLTQRPYKEAVSWKVVVSESRRQSVGVIACYSEEAEAMAHARQIVSVMREREIVREEVVPGSHSWYKEKEVS